MARRIHDLAATMLTEDQSVCVEFWKPSVYAGCTSFEYAYVINVKSFNYADAPVPNGEVMNKGVCFKGLAKYVTYNVTKEEGNEFYKMLKGKGFKKLEIKI